ncbi:MAG: MliC family protein [Anaerolineae bacterium]|nr:MliC family protein [Anaerolineae bacterium]
MKRTFSYVISFIAISGLLQGCGPTLQPTATNRVASNSSTPTIVVNIIEPTKPVPTQAPPTARPTQVPTVAATATPQPPTATTQPATKAASATATVQPTSAVPPVSYACALGKSFKAIFDKNKAIVQLPDKTTELLRMPSESGVLFAGGDITLLTQGSDAFVEENGKLVYYNCRAQQGSAAAIQASAAAVANIATPIAVAPTATPTGGALVPAVVLPASTAPAIATPVPTAPPAKPAQIAVGTPSAQSFFGCDGNKNFRVAYYPTGVLLDFNTESAQLRPQPSQSGKIWSNEEWTLVVQGAFVFVEQNGIMRLTNCKLR